MSRKKQPPRATLGDRDRAAIWAFRYCLGRTTYAVSTCVDWLIAEWPLLDQHAREIIARDLREEIQRDDAFRESGAKHKPLGWDCDRKEWLRLMAFIEGDKADQNTSLRRTCGRHECLMITSSQPPNGETP